MKDTHTSSKLKIGYRRITLCDGRQSAVTEDQRALILAWQASRRKKYDKENANAPVGAKGI
ncbi:MAG: hypothetical protein LBJ67_09105 [Planctomycetaceae bacterium]|jgi:hypothetical protein|nr:hypothetical protein [Planctomycetaceae bacterium]